MGLFQKMRSHHQQMQVTKKQIPGCAGNNGTANDSSCPLTKLPFVLFELMVCKGTADGGGNTCALECILLAGNETGGTEASNGKRLSQQN